MGEAILGILIEKDIERSGYKRWKKETGVETSCAGIDARIDTPVDEVRADVRGEAGRVENVEIVENIRSVESIGVESQAMKDSDEVVVSVGLMSENSSDIESRTEPSGEQRQNTHELPPLYTPLPGIPSQTLTPKLQSLMSIANAYIDKQDFPLAVKQFRSVLKKQDDFLPALIGFATFSEVSFNEATAGTSLNGTAIVEAYTKASVVALRLGEISTAGVLFDKGVAVAMGLSNWKECFEYMKDFAWNEEIMERIVFELGEHTVDRSDELKNLLETGLRDGGSVWVTDDVVKVLGEDHELVAGKARRNKKEGGGRPAGGGLDAQRSVFTKSVGDEKETTAHGEEDETLRKLALGNNL